MVARTIDNLGYDASERYARDQKLLDGHEALTQEAKVIFAKTSIEVMKPVFQLETDQAFQGALKTGVWADFPPPLGYEEQKRFFTHELLPSLGSGEKLELLKNKISQIGEQKEDNSDNPKQETTKTREEEENEKEKQVLINLLNCLLHLDNCIIYVHAKRAQYHKG